MLAFLDSPYLIEVVSGVPTFTENHTGIFKLSGSCWPIKLGASASASASASAI